MKISPMIKTVTCITYSALILLSIIILWCVFTSTVESFGSSSDTPKCYSSGGSTCSMPSTPTTPKCDSSSTTEDSPDDDTPDEILCQAAENPVAQTSEWTTHQGQGCAYLTKKGETKCNERHVVNGDTGEKVWCEWVNDECRTGGSCDVAADSPITPPDEGISAEAGKVLMTNYLNSSSIKDVAKAKYQASAPMGGNPSDWVDAWTSWRNGMVNAYLSYRGDDKTHDEAFEEVKNDVQQYLAAYL